MANQITDRIPNMLEPVRTLILQGMKILGKVSVEELLSYIEEQLTFDQRQDAEKFLNWLHRKRLTVGHGTIDLRYYEFKNRIPPMDKDEAYKWAMKRMGL